VLLGLLLPGCATERREAPWRQKADDWAARILTGRCGGNPDEAPQPWLGELAAVCDRFAGPAEGPAVASWKRVGPDLHVGRYAFEGLALRDTVTGAVRRHSGVLEVEVSERTGRLRYIRLRSDSLPPVVGDL